LRGATLEVPDEPDPSLICALSASRGRADERVCHLLLNPLHGAGADADLAGDLEDTLPGAQLSLDTFFNGGADPWLAERFACLYGPLEASIDALRSNSANAPVT
jgi:hypothetical protein